MQDQDLVALLPAASSVPLGTPVSKYLRGAAGRLPPSSPTDALEGSKLQDPALLTFIDRGQVIAKDELVSYHHTIASARRMSEDSDDLIQANALREDSSQEPREVEFETPSHIADGLPTPSNSLESEEERLNREQEERLAALGVTGFAKPVRKQAQRPVVLTTAISSETQLLTVDQRLENK